MTAEIKTSLEELKGKFENIFRELEQKDKERENTGIKNKKTKGPVQETQNQNNRNTRKKRKLQEEIIEEQFPELIHRRIQNTYKKETYSKDDHQIIYLRFTLKPGKQWSNDF